MSLQIDSHLIGKSIKAFRLSRNWTQDYLADAVGYSVRNLRRIENDGTSSIDVVNTFADIFKVSALDILSGDVFLFFIRILKMIYNYINQQINKLITGIYHFPIIKTLIQEE